MQQPEAYHCFLHQNVTCVCVCINVIQELCMLFINLLIAHVNDMSPKPAVFVFNDNAVCPRCHVSPHAYSVQ